MTTSSPHQLSELTQTVTRLNRLITQRTGRARPEHVFTQLQLETLSYLHANPGARVGALAQHLGISFSSVAQLLRRLDRAGWTVRTTGQHDRRGVTVQLTRRGQRHLKELAARRRQQLARLFHGVSGQELKVMAQVMATMYRNVTTYSLTL